MRRKNKTDSLLTAPLFDLNQRILEKRMPIPHPDKNGQIDVGFAQTLLERFGKMNHTIVIGRAAADRIVVTSYFAQAAGTKRPAPCYFEKKRFHFVTCRGTAETDDQHMIRIHAKLRDSSEGVAGSSTDCAITSSAVFSASRTQSGRPIP